MSVLIAIDPGASGGICVLRNGELRVEKALPTPRDTCDFLESVIDGDPAPNTRCVMEKVGGYVGGGGQPGSAMFEFGCGYGVYIGILTALKIPLELVTPQQWQKGLSLGSKGLAKAIIIDTMTAEQKETEKRRVKAINNRLKVEWKNKLKALAQQIYPHANVTLATADSLLILEWARRRERIQPAQPAQKELAV